MAHLEDVLHSLRAGPLGAHITAWEYIPAQEARFAPWPADLSPQVRAAYERRGVERLYVHQAETFKLLSEGKHVVVTTPTASGKTLCYNLPVLDAITKDSSARALYLFPTKALGHDQVAELEALNRALDPPVHAYAYDGDTPGEMRAAVRTRAQIVVTNPDMLHSGILPHHTKWMSLFRNLKYVVVDELHTYRGVFGSHVANLMRRLQRVSSFYGSQPLFILCSATIANPADLAQRIIGHPVSLVDDSGAPRGEKVVVFYNPPLVDQSLGIRRPYVQEAAHLASLFLKEAVMTIVFARARVTTEVLLTEIRRRVEKTPADAGLVRGYRGGYLPRERREIERGLREGRIRGVVSTNALELGIDIGSLDVAVLAGYPGTISSTWQQMGRAGRRRGLSAAVLVASSAPLDQFMVTHPGYFFGRSPEHGLIDPDNPLILYSHLKCAAFELPFKEGEVFAGRPVDAMLSYLQEHGVVRLSGGTWHWTADNYPADHVSLRSASSDNFVVVDRTASTSRVIGEVDFASAPMLLHERAIYLHEGIQYHVDQLDFAQRRAYVREVSVDYFTDAVTYTKVRVLDSFQRRTQEAATVEHGEVLVFSQVVGFKKIKFHTLENVGFGEVNLPENQMHTSSYWFSVDPSALATLPYPRDAVVDGLLGLLHALHHVAALYLMCDPRDLGATLGDREGEVVVERSITGGHVIRGETPAQFEPMVFLYDNLPGGVGFSPQLFETHDSLLRDTFSLIRACPCTHGCPSCVGPVTSPRTMAKEVALKLLRLLLPHDSPVGQGQAALPPTVPGLA